MTDVAESMDEDSKAYDAYVNSPVPTYQSIYMFNLTNYEDILRGKRPIVTELGPYVFKTVTQRNSSWYHDLVETTEVNAYYFEPNMSKGTLDDTIFTIDLYAITLLDMLQEKPHLKNISGNMTVFFNMTVRKLLYEGYEENNEWADILRFPGSLVSYLRPNNGSITKYQVYTGRSGRSKDTNAYYSWQNSKTLNYFKPACSNLDGTNGEFYQPTLYPPLIVKIFRRSLCKPWRLYLKDRFLRLGEPIVRYKALADLFSETGDPALDSCYSPNPTHRQGTFDATLCYMQDHNLTRYASQVILSSPHFLNGDPTLTQQISGLAPNEYEHGFYIDVHAKSGFVVDMRRRVQYNFRLLPTLQEPHLPPVIYPVYWEQIWRLPKDRDHIIDYLKRAWFPIGWIAVTAFLFFAFALINLVIAVACFARAPHDPVQETVSPSTKQLLGKGVSEQVLLTEPVSSMTSRFLSKSTQETSPKEIESLKKGLKSTLFDEGSVLEAIDSDGFSNSQTKSGKHGEDDDPETQTDSSAGLRPFVEIQPKPILRSRPAAANPKPKFVIPPNTSKNPYGPPPYPTQTYPPSLYPQGYQQSSNPAQRYAQSQNQSQTQQQTSNPAQLDTQSSNQSQGQQQSSNPAQIDTQSSNQSQGQQQSSNPAQIDTQSSNQSQGQQQSSNPAQIDTQSSNQSQGQQQSSNPAQIDTQSSNQSQGQQQSSNPAQIDTQSSNQSQGQQQSSNPAQMDTQSSNQPQGQQQSSKPAQMDTQSSDQFQGQQQSLNPAERYSQTTSPVHSYLQQTHAHTDRQVANQPLVGYPQQVQRILSTAAQPSSPLAAEAVTASPTAEQVTNGTRPLQ
ncbi:scavenger receptor class B member 1-like isoform X3 [Varroa destructor]|nr:scavenger receptor class B member 1-like isoform X3 [Varroa destructor]XP_022648597.1 scavenger receptor class B member 1-like isoform X3 [Varroa destructor]